MLINYLYWDGSRTLSSGTFSFLQISELLWQQLRRHFGRTSLSYRGRNMSSNLIRHYRHNHQLPKTLWHVVLNTRPAPNLSVWLKSHTMCCHRTETDGEFISKVFSNMAICIVFCMSAFAFVHIVSKTQHFSSVIYCKRCRLVVTARPYRKFFLPSSRESWLFRTNSKWWNTSRYNPALYWTPSAKESRSKHFTAILHCLQLTNNVYFQVRNTGKWKDCIAFTKL